MLSGIITLLFIPQLDEDCIQDEDIKFRDYLEQQGFETEKMGLPITNNVDDVEQIETGRRESCGTGVDGSKKEGEDHAGNFPVVKVKRKERGWFSKLMGVAP